MQKLTAIEKVLLLKLVGETGSYKPIDVMPYIEENLTLPQYKKLTKFLEWCCDKQRKFGHGNIDQLFTDYAKG